MRVVGWLVGVMIVFGVGAARADETVPPAKAAAPGFPAWPRIGGHLGLAVSVFAVDNDGTIAIGRDYVQVGVTPGITVKVADHWAVDFEFIGFSRWDFGKDGKPDRASTLFVVDPGVVYNFGRVAAGLRVAVIVGEGQPLNYGLIPIGVVPIRIDERLSWFFEIDLPVFVSGTPGRALGSFGTVLQSGVAF